MSPSHHPRDESPHFPGCELESGAYAVYVMVSLAVGHLVGSFMIEMTESLQNLLLGFLK